MDNADPEVLERRIWLKKPEEGIRPDFGSGRIPVTAIDKLRSIFSSIIKMANLLIMPPISNDWVPKDFKVLKSFMADSVFQ